MNTGQIQLRLTLTDQLYEFLQSWSNRLGIPVTQVVKHMIIEKAQKEEFPVFRASHATETAYKQAISDKSKATKVKNLDKFFQSL